MAYADQEMSGNRVVALTIVVLIHLAVGYALISGLAYSATQKIIERVTTVDIDEPEPEEPEPEPPPPEEVTTPPPPVAPPPPINVSVTPPQIQTVTTPPPPAPVIPIATLPPPPPPPSKARGASPRDQARWQRRIIENYPSRAIRNEEQGTVGLTVTVNAEGRVAGCRVTSSSGSNTLDDAACKDITRYARFNPALDDAGNPTSASWSTRIVYQLQ